MSEQATGRRFTGIPTTRVPAGGGFDEWFDLAESASTGDLLAARREAAGDSETLGEHLFPKFIKAWSFADANGQTLPITFQTVWALPFEVIEPAFDLFQKRQQAERDFLDPSESSKSSS